jgi:hypothetical protein
MLSIVVHDSAPCLSVATPRASLALSFLAELEHASVLRGSGIEDVTRFGCERDCRPLR